MVLNRRDALQTLAAAAALASLGAGAQQQFPSKPVKLVVGFAPGGLTDQIARLLAEGLTRKWGQQVIVENKSGGNLIPATQYVAKAPPDGYTLYVTISQPYSVNYAYYKSLPYTESDYTAVAGTSECPMGFYVPANSPFKTLGEFVSYSKAHPNKLNYGTPGQLSQAALAMEAFKFATGADIQNVPFQGGAPAVVAMLGGQIDMILSDMTTAAPHIKAGTMRVLAVIHDKRLPTLPDVPTMAEAGFGNVKVPVIWNGVFGPGKMPKQLVDKINADVNAVMQEPAIKKFLDENWLLPFGVTPQKLDSIVKADHAAYTPLMKQLNLRSE